ncbi:uncharacterized protein AMSG_05876 [Thecamonas trahens ATCC 50062]|uniref:FYVE-type domain-containing protein n=1 Tax=Thecamonas trahens ATCC 50062 TaxID=461836 RepID=A0A0L0DCQ8_THETB|nr:hypothetical protein AMSG_05876 [Thecamonas trahens ATCC 50062]KNC50104.1 hypothetical protein AMSG_05876 [Thecamonas trahens ATCC 50062]|eukprot:XP_013757263.1 hypothetical protein AMSG_05876 [Thecamonas trahens ATCC 50062]
MAAAAIRKRSSHMRPMARSRAPPDPKLEAHRKRRAVEVKVFALRREMRARGEPEAEIEAAIAHFRAKLAAEFAEKEKAAVEAEIERERKAKEEAEELQTEAAERERVAALRKAIFEKRKAKKAAALAAAARGSAASASPSRSRSRSRSRERNHKTPPHSRSSRSSQRSRRSRRRRRSPSYSYSASGSASASYPYSYSGSASGSYSGSGSGSGSGKRTRSRKSKGKGRSIKRSASAKRTTRAADSAQLADEVALAATALVESSVDGTIFDYSPELKFLCKVVEDALAFGLAGKARLFGSNRRHFWYMLDETGRKAGGALKDAAVAAAGEPSVRSPAGKGRVWIRNALAGKQLAIFLHALWIEHHMDMYDFYDSFALAVNRDLAEAILEALVPLASVDFELVASNVSLDDSWEPLVEVPKWRRRAATVDARPPTRPARAAPDEPSAEASHPPPQTPFRKRSASAVDPGDWKTKHERLRAKMDVLQSMHAADYAHLQDRYKSLQRDFDEACLELAQLRQALRDKRPAPLAASDVSGERTAASALQTELDNAVAAAAAREAELVAALEAKSAELDAARAAHAELAANDAKARNKNEQMQIVLRETKAQLQKLAEDHHALSSLHSHLGTIHRKTLAELAEAQSAGPTPEVANRLAALESQLDDARAAAAAATAERDSAHAEHVELILAHEEAQREIEALKRAAEAGTAAAAASRAAAMARAEAEKTAAARIAQLEEAVAAGEAAAAAAAAERDALVTRLASLEAEMQCAAEASRSALELQSQSRMEAEAQAREATAKLQKTASALAACEAKASTRASQIDELQRARSAAEESAAQASEEAAVAHEAAQAMTQSVSDLVTLNTELEGQVSMLTAQVADLEQRWTVAGKNEKEASACCGCGDDFTFFNRKHHCRRCGLIFCNDCTLHRATLKAACKPVRVCTHCHAAVRIDTGDANGDPIVATDLSPSPSPRAQP